MALGARHPTALYRTANGALGLLLVTDNPSPNPDHLPAGHSTHLAPPYPPHFHQAMPLVDCMASLLDMRRPDDLTRSPMRPGQVRRLAKGLYNVRVRKALEFPRRSATTSQPPTSNLQPPGPGPRPQRHPPQNHPQYHRQGRPSAPIQERADRQEHERRRLLQIHQQVGVGGWGEAY